MMATGFALPRRAHAAEARSLFHIERSTNANIVQYDAVLDDERTLNPKTPVVGYWIRKAEDGRRRAFNDLDKLAYGFSVTPEKGASSWILRLKAASNRPIRVLLWGDRWVPQIVIAGASAVLDRLYVATDEKGIVPSVRYVDAFGFDMRTGAPVTERLKS